MLKKIKINIKIRIKYNKLKIVWNAAFVQDSRYFSSGINYSPDLYSREIQNEV